MHADIHTEIDTWVITVDVTVKNAKFENMTFGGEENYETQTLEMGFGTLPHPLTARKMKM